MAKKTVRDRFKVSVDTLDQEGRGVSRREGKVVFIEGALPGEIVEYERYRNKPAFEMGIAVEIYKESSLRVKPECPYFGAADGSCGGCALQHFEPHAQVAVKQKVLTDALERIGKVKAEQLLPPIYGPFWGYRYRARLSVKDVLKKGTVLVGFHEKRSSYIADMKTCMVLPERMRKLLVPLRELVGSLSIRQKLPQIEVAITEDTIALALRILEKPSGEDEEKLRNFEREHNVEFWYQPKGPETVYPMNAENFDHLRLRHHETGVSIAFKPTDFTQVNHRLNEVMVSRALRLLRLQPDEHVADFFCGLGNFTLPIATKVKQVYGIEGSKELVERAGKGAEQNGLAGKAAFEVRNLFDWTLDDWEKLFKDMNGIDKVLIDPPRDGAFAVSKSLADTTNRPKRIVYVSCNPATLARDANVLVNEGGWILKAAGVMNMFPHTAHVESIAVFEDGGKKKAPDFFEEIEEKAIENEAMKTASDGQPNT